MKSLFDYGREVFSQQQALQIGKTGNFGLFRPVANIPTSRRRPAFSSHLIASVAMQNQDPIIS
jgi:hypothetical protein